MFTRRLGLSLGFQISRDDLGNWAGREGVSS